MKKVTKKRVIHKKKLAKQKVARKKAEVRTKAGGSKTTGGKTVDALKEEVRGKSQSVDTVAFALEGLGARSDERSGDLQGLSNVEGADSESVDELLEEGNAFEADAVKGVEDADDADEREVRTHKVLQDDVPSEYLDEDVMSEGLCRCGAFPGNASWKVSVRIDRMLCVVLLAGNPSMEGQNESGNSYWHTTDRFYTSNLRSLDCSLC